MIKLENYEVLGWEHVVRGMRNPMNSWAKSDSVFKETTTTTALDYSENPDGDLKDIFVQFDALSIGPNDHDLMLKLRNAGTDHRKFMRMITVYVDITAPLYWWKEFDTYKVGTVANSCSTMHKIHAKEFTMGDFSAEHLTCLQDDPNLFVDMSGVGDLSSIYSPIGYFGQLIEMLNKCRDLYLETNDKKYWWQMIQLLPTSYNQKRTVMLNYEVLANMYKSRKNHKLDEWRELCAWIESLPYSEIITGKTEESADAVDTI